MCRIYEIRPKRTCLNARKLIQSSRGGEITRWHARIRALRTGRQEAGVPRFCILAVLLLCTASVIAQLTDLYPLQESQWSISLDSSWKFKYLPTSDAGSDAGFYNPTFDVNTWSDIPVPSHWELHGFAPPKYKHVDKGLGLYRRNFRVPTNWRDRRVFVRFEGVLYGFDLWVNGMAIGSWSSSYNPSTFDITDALNVDGDNTLSVQVTTRCKGYEFDQNDCWALSGIYRDVTLFSMPQTYLKDYTVRTTVEPDGSARVQLSVIAAGTGAGLCGITGRLSSSSNDLVKNFRFPLASRADGAAHGEVSFVVEHARLWTAETPELYRIDLSLQKDNRSLQEAHERIGLRQVSIEGAVLKLNGRPIKLRGIDHHDIWPREGRTATDKLLRGDLDLISRANINFIRTSHYPPDKRFIEMCDEMGIYVMCEVPFGFGDEHLFDPTYQSNLLTRARATVLRDKNRPSVIIWSVGNENPITPIQLETGREVKRLDPTRPICYPTSGTYFSSNYQRFPDFVDVYSPHYPVVAKLKEYAQTLTRPVIATEYAHALGLAADRIQDEWEVMYACPRLAGGAIWMFQDQGLLRATNTPVNPLAPERYVWPDPLHYYDTYGNDGIDGIVYSDRTPQVDYWEVRKVYSPVQIRETVAMLKPGPQEIALTVENRFDFRTLDGIELNWSVHTNRGVAQSGTHRLQIGPHQTETIRLNLASPQEIDKEICWLRLECKNEKKETFYEHCVCLRDKQNTSVAHILQKGSRTASRLEVIRDKGFTRIKGEQCEAIFSEKTGQLEFLNSNRDKIAAGPFLHTGRKFTLAEEMRLKSTSIWRGTILTNFQVQTSRVTETREGIELSIKGSYAREDAADQQFVGSHTLLISPKGVITVTYNYKPVNCAGTLLEAGMSFLAPADASEFYWVGQGPYAGYPGKDRLNDFGIFHLNSQDIRFQGNRRQVEVALLARPSGMGMAVFGDEMDVAVENQVEGIVFSHNAKISGRGNKGGVPESSVKASDPAGISGTFSVALVPAAWPAAFKAWFGDSGIAAEIQHPFYQSYDQ